MVDRWVFFFLHNKVKLRKQDPGRQQTSAPCWSFGCGVCRPWRLKCSICVFLVSGMLQQHDKKTGKKVERSFQHVTFFWGIPTARPRGCLMFQRWDAMHTTIPVFTFRLVVKRVSAVKQSRSTHRPLSDTERWRLSCCIRKRSTVFTISSAG